ncbi:phosphotransferase [Thalassomonas viridans]|uniref:Phosphotransferase n=1 Tax=Thalassomonas viridans TaxID=137584 RepID=A0AAF0C587_9GAMM|nr:phosphotransferase [Thalassomonas viridans]WDE03072.1 phosphotransferase [Thalassomonas viridans]
MTLPAIHTNGVSLDELIALPCFKAIEEVQAITSGYSQSCVKVIDNGQAYFVKKFADGNSSIEQTCRNERLFSVAAGKAGISPRVLYQDARYLVCDYIEGELLSASDLPTEEKLGFALALMTSCHQLDVAIPILDMVAVITELTSALTGSDGAGGRLNGAQQSLIKTLTGTITAGITPGPLFPCHGDINFSNILLTTQPGNSARKIRTKAAWLIDFECCALAEKEFDLAMLIAVNEIPHPKMLALLEQRQLGAFLDHGQYSNKLRLYLAFCYLINALWYLVYQLESGDKQFAPLAQRQFALLDELALVDGSFAELFADFYPENEISC